MDEFRGHDVACTDFPVRRRGYDPDAVAAHLSKVGAWVDTLLTRLAEAGRTERAAVLLLQKAQVTADETILGSAMYADQLRARAEADAEDRLAAARARADDIVRTARQRAESILLEAATELTEVRRATEDARRRLAMTEASIARAAEHRSTELRRQAGHLLNLADEVASTRPSAEDALVVPTVVLATDAVGSDRVTTQRVPT